MKQNQLDYQKHIKKLEIYNRMNILNINSLIVQIFMSSSNQMKNVYVE